VRSEFHGASLRTRIRQGVFLAVFMTVGRLVVGLASARGASITEILVLFGAVSSGGATGGVTYYVTDPLRAAGGWRKTLANVLSLLVYCFVTLLVFGVVWWATHGSLFE